jgi:HEPN domain-containing protein
VVDRKKIREAINWTFQTTQADPFAWYKEALSFHEAAVILYNHKGHFTRTFAFNAGLSLELALKSILVAKGAKPRITHKISELAAQAEVDIDAAQKDTLDIFAVIVEWQGRYPAPTSEAKWDDFHDKIQEKIIIRRRDKNVFKTLVVADRFPSFQNYLRLWNLCNAEFRKAAQSAP